MHIIYFGSVTSKEEIMGLSGGSVAGNKMQWNVLKELVKYEDVTLDAFTIASIAAFPREKKIFIKEERKEISEGIWVTQVPFVNIPIIKQFSQSHSLYRYAKKVADEGSIAFSYNLYMQEGNALMKLRKRCRCKIAALLADLPIDDNYTRNGFSKIFYKIFFDLSKKNIKHCPNLVVLNRNAIEEYAPKAKYIVVEGGIEKEEIESFINYKVSQKNLIYSGALTEYSGIKELISAMKYIDKSVVLEIYGDGPERKNIEILSGKYTNVLYKGKISNEEMKCIQKRAWILVNPRPVDDKIANVTFPSKIFEYMISGRPVLSTKQTGFTGEYLQHMFIAENNKPETLAECINKIFSMDETLLLQKSKDSFQFIAENKTWQMQVKKIYYFFCQIIKGDFIEKN